MRGQIGRPGWSAREWPFFSVVVVLLTLAAASHPIAGLLVASALGLFGVAYDALIASRRTPRLKLERLIVLGLIVTPASLFVITSVLGVWPQGYPMAVPSYFQREPSAAATRSAQGAIKSATPQGDCTIVTNDPVGILPTPYQRCSWVGGLGAQVDYVLNWDGAPTVGGAASPFGRHGLSFRLDGADPVDADTCVKHLGGQWWAFMPEGDPGGDVCPDSFHLQGGG
jgi:hypothetical protein